MSKAVYPGSFDPFSNGHLDIVKRASKLFDEIHVLVSNNIFKKTIFTADERIELIKKCTKDIPNLVITSFDGLVVQYCKENEISIIIRGLRNYSDYEAEFSLYQYNKDIYPNVETILLLPSTKTQFVSSSAIKELLNFNCEISKYVPAEIEQDIINRMKK